MMLPGDFYAREAEALAAPLYRFVLSRGARAHDAMDLVQETLLRALAGRASVREPARFRGFVYGIARHVLADSRRRPAPAGPLAAEDLPARGGDPAARDDARTLRAAVESLPDELREVLLLHYYDDLSYEEIAAALALPRPTVQGRLRRAKEILRARLRGAFGEEDGAARQAVRGALGVAAIPPSLEASVRDALAGAPNLAPAAAGAKPFLAAGAAAVVAAAGALAWLRPTEPPRPAREAPRALVLASSEPAAARIVAPITSDPAKPRAATAPPLDPASPEALERALALLSRERDATPPPYPYAWPAGSRPLDPALAKRLARKVTVDFPGISFASGLEFLRAVDLPMSLDDEARARMEADPVTLNLRLREITAKNAIDLMVSQARDLCYVADGASLRIVLNPGSEDEDRPRELDAHARRYAVNYTPYVPPAWIAEYRGVLANRRVTLDLRNVTLKDAILELQEASGLNLVIDQGIDAEEKRFTAFATDVPAGEALARILGAAGRELRFQLERESVIVTNAPAWVDPPADPGPILAERTVALAPLVGAGVPALVRALESQGLPVAVSPETWASRGTLSLGAVSGSAADVVAALNAETPLRAEIVLVEKSPRREMLALRGEVASAAPPLAGLAPEPFEEWTRSRADLVGLVLAREEARGNPPAAGLFELERAVARGAADLDRYLARAAEVATARERQRSLPPKLADARRALAERVPAAAAAEAVLQAAGAQDEEWHKGPPGFDVLLVEPRLTAQDQAVLEACRAQATDPRGAELVRELERELRKRRALEVTEGAYADLRRRVEAAALAYSIAASRALASEGEIADLEHAIAIADREAAILDRLEKSEPLAAAEAAEPAPSRPGDDGQ